MATSPAPTDDPNDRPRQWLGTSGTRSVDFWRIEMRNILDTAFSTHREAMKDSLARNSALMNEMLENQREIMERLNTIINRGWKGER